MMESREHQVQSSDPLARFAQKWCHQDHRPKPIDSAALRTAEVELGVAFPDDYKRQVLAVGAPYTTLALSSAILDMNVDLHVLSDLHDPHEIVEGTRGWQSAGMPASLIAIGSDLGGNQFCFSVGDLRGPSVSTAPVYFWDHDFGTTDRIADSFSAWIETYLGAWSDGRSATDF